MSVLFVALPVAIGLGALAVAGFVWAARGGQFDDLETPRWRVLTDDQSRPPPGGTPAREVQETASGAEATPSAGCADRQDDRR